jgi:hypothetical protein
MGVILIEQVKEEFTPDMVYWAFDWDDNILKMPTQIILKDKNGNEVGMSTEDFAEYRHEIGIKDFEYKGHTIVGYANDPYRQFGEKGDKKFQIDAFLAKPAVAWDDFVKAINSGSVFAIITARGHSPLKIRSTIEKMINGNYKGINKKELVKNLRKYREFAGEEDMEDSEIIDAYLDMNKYYPVTFGQGSAQSPEKGKEIALKEFENYVKYLSKVLQTPAYLKNKISNSFLPVIIFSDDDEKNLEHSHKKLSNRPENIIQFVSTKGGEKKLYTGNEN